MARGAKAFAKLDNIISKIHKLSSGEFQKGALGDVAEVMYDLAEDGIAAGRNPLGRAWRKLSPRTRNKGLPLHLAASSLSKSIAATLAKLVVDFPHANAQQRGASRPLTDAKTGKALNAVQMRLLRKGEAKSLIRSGALKRGWKLPARSMLPKGGKLPPKWRDAIEARMRQRFGELWSKG